MTDLVSGSSGFIGGHIARALREPLLLDIKELDDIRYVNSLPRIKTIYHQAAVPSVPRSLKAPVMITSVNVLGTVNMLEVARRYGVRNFVFASSSSIYGGMGDDELEIYEEREANPLSPYAASKLACEKYLNVYNELYDMNCTVLRYFNVYGPGQNPNSQYAAVIPKFLKRAREGKPLEIYGDGEQKRSFVYVGDVVEANLKAAGKRGTFNIGYPKPTTVNELAEIIINLTDSKSKIAHVKPRKGDIRNSVPCIEKAKRELGWKPKVSIEEGIGKILENE